MPTAKSCVKPPHYGAGVHEELSGFTLASPGGEVANGTAPLRTTERNAKGRSGLGVVSSVG